MRAAGIDDEEIASSGPRLAHSFVQILDTRLQTAGFTQGMAERGTQIKLDREIRLTIAYDWTAITAICRGTAVSRRYCTEPDVEGRSLGF